MGVSAPLGDLGIIAMAEGLLSLCILPSSVHLKELEHSLVYRTNTCVRATAF